MDEHILVVCDWSGGSSIGNSEVVPVRRLCMEVVQFEDDTSFTPRLHCCSEILPLRGAPSAGKSLTYQMIIVLITQWRDTMTTLLCRTLASGDGDE